MSYKRSQQLPDKVGDKHLSQLLAGIGFNITSKAKINPNIEDTIYLAAIEGMENDDLRILSLLALWFETHSSWINANRLFNLVSNCPHSRTQAFWAALAHNSKDRRFEKMKKIYRGTKLPLLKTGNDFQLSRKGQDPRFSRGPLEVPAGILRKREADVLRPEALAKKHRGYFWRVLSGPTYRADMLGILDHNPSTPAAELARSAHGSYATAWRVLAEYMITFPQP